MNAPDPLAALHPLREPAAIGWWPPAPGWWLLAFAGAALLAVLCVLALRRRRAGAYRRRALSRLETVYADYAQHGDDIAFTSEVNALLKRVAIDVYGNHIAAASGEAWEQFLRDSAPEGPRFAAGFSQAIYSASAQAPSPDAHYRAARHWLRQHRVSI